MKKALQIIMPIFVTHFLFACIGSKYSNKVKGSEVSMTKDEKRDVIDFAKIQKQDIPGLFALRDNKSRGFITPSVMEGVVSLAKQGVKKIIDNEKKNTKQHILNHLTIFFSMISYRSMGRWTHLVSNSMDFQL